MLVGEAILNALAFMRSNFIFESIGTENWWRTKMAQLGFWKIDKQIKFLKRIDQIPRLSEWMNKKEANAQKINSTPVEYNGITNENLEVPNYISHKPKLSNFYEPSDKQKTIKVIFIIWGMPLLGFLVYKIIK